MPRRCKSTGKVDSPVHMSPSGLCRLRPQPVGGRSTFTKIKEPKIGHRSGQVKLTRELPKLKLRRNHDTIKTPGPPRAKVSNARLACACVVVTGARLI